MHIQDTPVLHECTSCQLCAAVCPRNAITIGMDADGFYRPSVNRERCIDCSLCTKVCYRFTTPFPTSKHELEQLPVYAATAKDKNVLQQTSSGGVADVLARYLARNGWLCVGVEYYGKSDIARHTIVTTEDGTERFRGSKYIQSYTLDAFREVATSCLDRRVAIFGTPCQIYSLDLFLKHRGKRENFLLIDIYCHGCPSMLVWKKYIACVKEQYGWPAVSNLTFRSKVRGWGAFHVEAGCASQRQTYLSPRSRDEFFTLFFSDHILNKACHDCLCRSTIAHTDIRLGDFWGKNYDLDREGVSIVTCVTLKGQQLFEEVQTELTVRKHIHADYLPYQSYGKDYRPDEKLRRQMLDRLADPQSLLADVIYLFYKQQPISYHIKRLFKEQVLKLPPSWINRIKQFYH